MVSLKFILRPERNVALLFALRVRAEKVTLGKVAL